MSGEGGASVSLLKAFNPKAAEVCCLVLDGKAVHVVPQVDHWVLNLAWFVDQALRPPKERDVSSRMLSLGVASLIEQVLERVGQPCVFSQ